MAVTAERAQEVASIIRSADITDEEVRHYMKSRTKKNKSRAAFVKKTIEELEEKGEILMEDMKNYPAAPTDPNLLRKARSDALAAARRQGFPTEKIGNKYVVVRDLSEHVSWFRRHGNMNLDTFKLNCKNRKVSPEAMKTALKEDGVFFTEAGMMV